MSFTTFFVDYFTPITVLIGGGWYFFNWILDQVRGRHRDMPALDAALGAQIGRLTKENAFVMLTKAWKNPGPYCVYFHSEESFVDVYEISPDLEPGAYNYRADFGDPVYKAHPFRGRNVSAEPKTTSEHAVSFVLPYHKLYFCRWRSRRRDDKYSWTRDAIVDLRDKQLDLAGTRQPGTNG